MSYCVNCGVQLDDAATRCPLCGTPVLNPAKLKKAESENAPFFPANRVEVPPASKRELAVLLSALMASVSVCCAVLNLLLRSSHTWSLYVIGACVMLWIWLVPPLLARGIPAWLRLLMDCTAISIYVYLIAYDLDGMDWFWRLALPIIAAGCAVALALCLLLYGRNHSFLSTVTMSIAGIGIFFLLMEAVIDYYFSAQWQPGWSLIILTVCMALILPLLVIRRVSGLREEVRRRFHM